MTLTELIERIKVVAYETGDLIDERLASKEMLIEIILPKIMQEIGKKAVSKPASLASLKKNHTISLTAGVGTLPAGVYEKYAEAMIIKSGYFSQYASYYREYVDYLNDFESMFPRFTVEDGNIYYSGQDTGNITLSAITMPVLPATAGATVDLDDFWLEQLIPFTAGVIRGEIPLTTLGMSQ